MPSGAIPYPFGDCRVCGDHATGVHYGVATCEGCKGHHAGRLLVKINFRRPIPKILRQIKGFYKRSLSKAHKYRCFHGNKCTISPVERNRCKSCRYQRCINVGMSVDGVKMGRIPKVDKERALEEHYGCGSREILSSGLVIPQTNKRTHREASDSSKPSGRGAGAREGPMHAYDPQRFEMDGNIEEGFRTNIPSVVERVMARPNNNMQRRSVDSRPSYDESSRHSSTHSYFSSGFDPEEGQAVRSPMFGGAEGWRFGEGHDYSTDKFRGREAYRVQGNGYQGNGFQGNGYQGNGEGYSDWGSNGGHRHSYDDDDEDEDDVRYHQGGYGRVRGEGERNGNNGYCGNGERPTYSPPVINQLIAQVVDCSVNESRSSHNKHMKSHPPRVCPSPATYTSPSSTPGPLSHGGDSVTHCDATGAQDLSYGGSEGLRSRGQISRCDLELDNESVLKRSRSADELYCSVKSGDSKLKEEKRRSLDYDDTDLIVYDSSTRGLGRERELVTGNRVSAMGERKKRYELEDMVVEAGMRGKLRDAVDQICERMAFGDVPIMDLDSNALTASGEPIFDYRTVIPVQNVLGKARIQEIPENDGMEVEGVQESNMDIVEEIVIVDSASKLYEAERMDELMNYSSEPAQKRRLVEPMMIDGSRHQARYFMKQGYIGREGESCHTSFKDYGNMVVVSTRRGSGDSEGGAGDTVAMKKSRMMGRVLSCLQAFADKLMHLIEIEIGIAVDEATGRRPLHKLNDPDTEIGEEEVFVFWNDFMLTLPRGNSVVMGLCANVPGFKQLNVNDQLLLIEQAYYMLWMILYSRLFWDHECHIRINCEAVYSRSWYNRFFGEPLVDRMFSFVEELNQCHLSPTELIILCALQLTNVENRAKLENPSRVQLLHDYYLDLLGYEVEKSHPTNHSKILNKIFQLLPLLTPMNQQQLEVVDTFSVDRPPV